MDSANIASALTRMARERPHQIAIFVPCGRDLAGRAAHTHLTYAQLDEESDAIACGLDRIGIGRGVRTVLMVRPSLEFFVLMFGLFKVGAVPVLIDPGIAKSALKQCLAEAEPEAFIGIPLAHVARILFGWGRRTLKTWVTVGPRLGWGGKTYAELLALGREGSDARRRCPAVLADTRGEDAAAILFTSGSTGVPKGVVYEHRHFMAQVEMLRTAFDIRPGEIDLPTFPPFALFDPALGMTTVIPEMDPTRPAMADPAKLIQTIQDFGVTNLFASPALVNTLSRWGAPRGIKLPTLQRVISAGAPVPVAVVERMRKLLPEDAKLWTPYGATECLPVAIVEGRELVDYARARTERGAGTLVGRVVEPNTVRIIRISDEPIAQWSDDLLLPPGVVGEITVAGPTTTSRYYNRPEADRIAKIREGERIVHRMGDVGYCDESGRLWMCGRRSQRVETADGPLYTEQVEPIFNTHPQVFRSALVGVGPRGAEEPVLIVELEPDVARDEHARIREELLALAQRYAHTRQIRTILYYPRFPVDIRHNAKIGREFLKRWASARMGRPIAAATTDTERVS
jgi:acyl-CoA synthetase (AMP-forming)/AMP-acid ligase II